VVRRSGTGWSNRGFHQTGVRRGSEQGARNCTAAQSAQTGLEERGDTHDVVMQDPPGCQALSTWTMNRGGPVKQELIDDSGRS